ncbi:MAG: TIGR04290 family methyltransferase [Planctomycetes bacterium]|nr:TIGR04290 family methyltransferase [Planctomycetota bacterium]
MTAASSLPAEVTGAVDALGPWFHNLHLPGEVQTAPDHALGDFPRNKWLVIEPHVPDDLQGWTVLDVGCNAGFYSFELARRGATVHAIDLDEHYLRQARWAAEQLELADRVTFEKLPIYQLAQRPQRYDLVWFMGVLYHLRYPLLGLDIVARKTRRLMMFQTMTIPGEESFMPPDDVPLDQRRMLCDPAWPTMAFIERRVAGDPTNWWAANPSCVEAMLRSSGMRLVTRPAHEVYLCEPGANDGLGIGHLKEDEYLAATQFSPRT